jgi:hypothetical protein
MHRFLIYLCISFCLTCFGRSFSPSSEASVQFRQWFKFLGYGVSARPLVVNVYSWSRRLINWRSFCRLLYRVVDECSSVSEERTASIFSHWIWLMVPNQLGPNSRHSRFFLTTQASTWTVFIHAEDERSTLRRNVGSFFNLLTWSRNTKYDHNVTELLVKKTNWRTRSLPNLGCFSSWKYVGKAQKTGDLGIQSRNARHLIAAFRVTVPVVTHVHWKCLLGDLLVIRCVTTGALVGVPVDLRTPGVYYVMVCVIQLVVSVIQLSTVSSRLLYLWDRSTCGCGRRS